MLDKFDTQYEDSLNTIFKYGEDIHNERTGLGVRQKMMINHVYDVGNNRFPLVTTRKCSYKAAIAELLGYLKGYSSAAQFRVLGCSTWDSNANENTAWLNNPNRKGTDDMGRAYGPQMRAWLGSDGTMVDQLAAVYNKLKEGVDDRRLIITLHNPADSHLSCLDACMWTYTFFIENGQLNMFALQRSADFPLGVVFNQVQCFTFLALMSQITGIPAGKVHHQMINAHIYENQLPIVPEQLRREINKTPKLIINPLIKTLEDVTDWVSPEDFLVEDYYPHPPLKYPFAV